MKKIQKLSKAIGTKIQLLKFTNEATTNVVEKRSFTTVEKQRKTLESEIEEVHALKVEIQELKLENGEDLEGILEWSPTIKGN